MSTKFRPCIFPADKLPRSQPARLPEDSVPDHDASPAAAHLLLPPSSPYPASTCGRSGWHPRRNGDTAPPASTSPTSTLCSLRRRAARTPQTFCSLEPRSCPAMYTAGITASRPDASPSGPMSRPSNRYLAEHSAAENQEPMHWEFGCARTDRGDVAVQGCTGRQHRGRQQEVAVRGRARHQRGGCSTWLDSDKAHPHVCMLDVREYDSQYMQGRSQKLLKCGANTA
jgi:hypothetical protein